MHYPTYQSYRDAWNSAYDITPKIPLNIDIELSSICNLKCPFCYMSNPNYKKPEKEFMSFFMIDRIFEEVAQLGIPSIKFNWMGEPTLHMGFIVIMKNAKALGCHDLIINTNGYYNEVKNIGLMYATKVIFSLDSMVEKTYKKMRRGSNLEVVLDNITALIERGHKNIWARRVITDDNKKENFKDTVEQYFKGKVKVSEHNEFNRVQSVERHINQQKNMIRQYCGYPSQRLVIDVYGDIYPCCIDVFKTMRLGNIMNDSLIDVWESAELISIRKTLKHSNTTFPSKACANCASWISYKHPYAEKVKDKEIWKMR